MSAGASVTKPLVAVTGAGSGIGAAVARAFSAAGHPLLLTGRRVERLEALGLPDAMCRPVDVLDVDGYRAVVDEAQAASGPVDLLVNNAGTMALEQIAAQAPEAWSRQFEINCVGLLNCTSAVLPAMLERGGGTIINVGSTAGRTLYPNHTAYCASKHAVHTMTEGLRREAAPAGVRVILVAPGMVDSELLSGTDSEIHRQAWLDYRDEIGGAIAPEDIASAMLFAYQQPQNICIWEMVVAPTRQLS
jgi:NADP-dependent 3-hydroxy acid dehydrogenase YdfG